MKDEKLEKQLKNIMEKATPDVIDNIMENCINVKKDNVYEFKNNKKEGMIQMKKMITAFAAMFILVICGIFGYTNYSVNSVISLDVNPSVEIKANKNEKVLDVIALNKDGEKILENMNLKKVEVNTAVNAIVGSMVKNGYISDVKNSILISVENKDKLAGEKLQKELANNVNEVLKENKIEGAILSQSYKENTKQVEDIAKENNISEGKTKLILDILDEGLRNKNGQLVTFEQLSNLTINELNTIATTKKINFNEVTSLGTASEKLYIGEENAKNIAFGNSKVNASQAKKVKVNFDFEEGKFIYEVDFEVGDNKYDYEIDAKTGEIVNGEVENKITKEENKIEINNQNKPNIPNNNTENKDINKEQNKEELARLEKEKQRIDKEDDKIDAEEKVIKGKKKEIENRKVNLKNQEKSLETKIKNIESELKSLKEQIKNASEEEIENLEIKEESLEKQKDNLEEQKKNIEVQEKELSKQEKALEVQEKDLERREQALDDEERKIEEQIKALKSK